jgi:hypothetical protein
MEWFLRPSRLPAWTICAGFILLMIAMKLKSPQFRVAGGITIGIGLLLLLVAIFAFLVPDLIEARRADKHRNDRV